MAKQLSVNFKTIHNQCKKGGFQTNGQHDENKALITNVSDNVIEALRGTFDVIIDHASKSITMMRNAQISLPLREHGYAKDIIITFAGGQLMAVSR